MRWTGLSPHGPQCRSSARKEAQQRLVLEVTRFLSVLCRGRACGAGACGFTFHVEAWPVTLVKGTAMKTEALKQALRQITKVIAIPRVGHNQGDQLRRAKREIETVMRSGKVDEARLGRAVETIANVLLELAEDDATPR